MLKFPNPRDHWPLAIVPVLLLILARVFVHMAGGFEADPDYAYLANGLEILTFYPPSYNNHPGTTLEVLVAVVNLLTWLICWPFHRLGLVPDVLGKSQFYLGANNAVLVTAIAAATFWFGDRVRRASGSLGGALAGQVSLLMCFSAMLALNRVTPEPLLLAAALVLAGVLAPLAFGNDSDRPRTAMIAGILVGFCIATKITALPLFPVLLLLPGWALRKRAALFTIGAIIFFTLPTAHHYLQMLSWMTGVATHSGTYGAGPAGLPAAGVLLARAWALFGQTPELFIGVAVYAGMLLWGPRRFRPLMAASALVVGAQIVMVLKMPTPRYLVPAIGVFALANAAIATVLFSRARILGLAAATGVVAAGLFCNSFTTAAWARANRTMELANHAVMRQVATSRCAVVPYYQASLEVYSLDFGNQYAAYRFRDALQRLYPKSATYDVWRHSFAFFGTPLSPAQLQAHVAPARCIYLVGSPVERYGDSFGIPSNALTLVTRARTDDGLPLAVYRYRP